MPADPKLREELEEPVRADEPEMAAAVLVAVIAEPEVAEPEPALGPEMTEPVPALGRVPDPVAEPEGASADED